MAFFNNLKQRGLLEQASDEEAIAKLSGCSFYSGFDPTASSLQVGNLIPVLSMVHIARSGLKPIALFGGATGVIGDPSGKSEERNLLAEDTVEQNVSQQKLQLQGIFERLNTEVSFVNNYDWTHNLSTLDFLRDCGKHFTVNYMLAKDSVSARLDGAGISYTEFSYMLLQAYDFLHLYQNHNCRLQIGGSDQWGNITAGLELIRRKIQGQAYALTMPLVTDNQGKKLGKTESGTIWLDPKLTSPYRFHQYWLNCEDSSAIRLLKLLTFIDLEQIAELENSLQQEPQKRKAQNALADALCDLVHGSEATKLARKSAEVLFGGSLEGLSDATLLDIFDDVPSIELSNDELKQLSYIELLVRSKLVKSKGEARRLVQNGGAYLNNQRISDVDYSLNSGEALQSSLLVLRSGKKNYCLVKQVQ